MSPVCPEHLSQASPVFDLEKMRDPFSAGALQQAGNQQLSGLPMVVL